MEILQEIAEVCVPGVLPNESNLRIDGVDPRVGKHPACALQYRQVVAFRVRLENVDVRYVVFAAESVDGVQADLGLAQSAIDVFGQRVPSAILLYEDALRIFPVTEAIERALLDYLCLLLRESTTATSTGLAYHRYIMAIG